MPLGNWNVCSQEGKAIDKPWLLVCIHNTLPENGAKQIGTAQTVVGMLGQKPETKYQIEHTRLAGWVRRPLVWLGIHWRSTEQPTFITLLLLIASPPPCPHYLLTKFQK